MKRRTFLTLPAAVAGAALGLKKDEVYAESRPNRLSMNSLEAGGGSGLGETNEQEVLFDLDIVPIEFGKIFDVSASTGIEQVHILIGGEKYSLADLSTIGIMQGRNALNYIADESSLALAAKFFGANRNFNLDTAIRAGIIGNICGERGIPDEQLPLLKNAALYTFTQSPQELAENCGSEAAACARNGAIYVPEDNPLADLVHETEHIFQDSIIKLLREANFGDYIDGASQIEDRQISYFGTDISNLGLSWEEDGQVHVFNANFFDELSADMFSEAFHYRQVARLFGAEKADIYLSLQTANYPYYAVLVTEFYEMARILAKDDNLFAGYNDAYFNSNYPELARIVGSAFGDFNPDVFTFGSDQQLLYKGLNLDNLPRDIRNGIIALADWAFSATYARTNNKFLSRAVHRVMPDSQGVYPDILPIQLYGPVSNMAKFDELYEGRAEIDETQLLGVAAQLAKATEGQFNRTLKYIADSRMVTGEELPEAVYFSHYDLPVAALEAETKPTYYGEGDIQVQHLKTIFRGLFFENLNSQKVRDLNAHNLFIYQQNGERIPVYLEFNGDYSVINRVVAQDAMFEAWCELAASISAVYLGYMDMDQVRWRERDDDNDAFKSDLNHILDSIGLKGLVSHFSKHNSPYPNIFMEDLEIIPSLRENASTKAGHSNILTNLSISITDASGTQIELAVDGGIEGNHIPLPTEMVTLLQQRFPAAINIQTIRIPK